MAVRKSMTQPIPLRCCSHARSSLFGLISVSERNISPGLMRRPWCAGVLPRSRKLGAQRSGDVIDFTSDLAVAQHLAQQIRYAVIHDRADGCHQAAFQSARCMAITAAHGGFDIGVEPIQRE